MTDTGLNTNGRPSKLKGTGKTVRSSLKIEQKMDVWTFIRMFSHKKNGFYDVELKHAEIYAPFMKVVGHKWSANKVAEYASFCLGYRVGHGLVTRLYKKKGYPIVARRPKAQKELPLAAPTEAVVAIPASLAQEVESIRRIQIMMLTQLVNKGIVVI